MAATAADRENIDFMVKSMGRLGERKKRRFGSEGAAQTRTTIEGSGSGQATDMSDWMEVVG
jgi:hypothetical protein